MSWTFPLCSRSFMVIFSYLIHFELIFVCNMHAICFVCEYPVFPTPLSIKETIFLLHSFGTLVKDHLNIYMTCVCSNFIYIYTYIYIYIYIYTHIYIYLVSLFCSKRLYVCIYANTILPFLLWLLLLYLERKKCETSRFVSLSHKCFVFSGFFEITDKF